MLTSRSRWVILTIILLLFFSTVGCETIVRNVIVPQVEELIEDKKPGDEPKGGGHGRGGSKDTTGSSTP